MPPQLHGLWPSPLSARTIGSAARLLDAQWDAHADAVVWLETRGGQSALTMQHIGSYPPDAPRLLTEPDQTPRARLGYGGGDFTVSGGMVCFAGNGGRLYRAPLTGGRARPISPAFGHCAAPRLSPDGRWVIAVQDYERRTVLIALPADGSQYPVKIASGDDFYAQPAWSPSGDRIAYVAWKHPQMPWDGCELRIATVQSASSSTGPVLTVGAAVTIAGGMDTSIFQPEFSPDGRYLAYVSDAAGWWQLYLYDLASGQHRRLTADEAEYGQPNWIHGLRMYGWTEHGRALIALRNQHSAITAWHIDAATGHAQPITTAPYTNLWQISVHPERPAFVALASAPTTPDRVVLFDAERDRPVTLSPISAGDTPGILVFAADNAPAQQRVLHRASSENLDPAALSPSRAITWTGTDGDPVYGIYYPPTGGSAPGLPPLLIHIHGGPTSQVRHTYSAEMQFYATRGFAVLQVNHRGGTGYGKAYKDRGRGAWGVYEVDDAVSGAQHLAADGLIDLNKVAIWGSSSGGFAVLHALVTRPGFFRAGVCSAGIADQFTLLKDGLDKFEERYSETIVGPLPDALPVYHERSPLFHADRISDPLILFHGLDDTNVPPENSQQIAAAVTRRGVPCELHLYPGEGHSLRQPDNIADYYSKALAFLVRHVVYGVR